MDVSITNKKVLNKKTSKIQNTSKVVKPTKTKIQQAPEKIPVPRSSPLLLAPRPPGRIEQ